MRDTGPGFRYFKCDECGVEWIDPSRDRNSPSGEECPGLVEYKERCSAWIMATPATTEQYDRLHKT